MAVWSEVKTVDIITASRLDAEFFRQDYLDSLKIIRRRGGYKLKKINVEIVSGPFGSSLKSSEYITKGIPFIRISDLENFFIKKNGLVYISEQSNAKIRGSELNCGDLILSKVGNSIGIVSILDEDFQRVNISENNIGIRFGQSVDENIKSFLVVYLNSKYGQNEILRRRSGNAQPKLNVSDIYSIEVPEVKKEEINKIYLIVTNIRRLTKLSQSLYTQAIQMLESELGLDKLRFHKPLSYEARLSEVVGNNRTDADYYQTKYRQLDNLLSKFMVRKIKNISEKIETGIYSQKYSEVGSHYIRGVDIKNCFIERDSVYKTQYLKPTYKSTVQTKDILVTRVGSIGVCGIVEDVLSGSFYSDNLIRIRLKDTTKEIINAYCLNLLLNTTVGQMQMIRFSRGSVQQRLNQTQLAEVPIPIININVQQKIEKILKEHRDKKAESQQLLEQAKRRVEELIEEVVEK